ncbi:MAG: hypothetical protein ACK5KO_10980 [Arachnia sp.]
MRKRQRRIWWATWPGALGLGLVSMVLAGIPAAMFVYYALSAVASTAGTDAVAVEAPSVLVRLSYAVAGVIMAALPVLTVILARRRWLGYLLLALAASLVATMAGLANLGIV